MSCVAYFFIFLFFVIYTILHQISLLTDPVKVKTVEEINQNNSSKSFAAKKWNKPISLNLTPLANLSTKYFKPPIDSALLKKYLEKPLNEFETTSKSSHGEFVKKFEPSNYVYPIQAQISQATIDKEINQLTEKDYVPNIVNKHKKPEIQILSKATELIEKTQITYTNSYFTSTKPPNTKKKKLSSPLSTSLHLNYQSATPVTTKSSQTKNNTFSTRCSTKHNSWRNDGSQNPPMADSLYIESLKRASQSHEADTASHCPRLHGHFPLDYTECSKYIRCEFGKPIIMPCPAGLVFNVKLEACDWPVNVPSCNPEVFHGFACPVSEFNKNKIPDEVINIRYGQSCKKYIACQEGRPRLLNCDFGLSFSHETRSCIRSDFVSNCRD